MPRSIYPHLPSEHEAKTNFQHVDFILTYYNSQHASNNPNPSWKFCTAVFVYAIGETHKPFSPSKRTCFQFRREPTPAAAVEVKGEVTVHTMTAYREVVV
jgi:hypothetical protein